VFRFIEAEKANHAVSTMCRVLGVSRSGYYAWAGRPSSERAEANAALTVEIRRVHVESDGTYGSRRVHAQLRREGRPVNLKRVERLMRVEGIQGAYVPPKRRRDGGDGVLGVDGVRVWPDLVKRDFRPAGPNELWCSDMKQIPTGEGVLHLASVLDCFSRRIVGWAMGPVADAPLVARALEMAVAQRRPGEGIIHHADRGCQYTAVTFGAACRANRITQSNSRKGTPHDNAAKESFFASLENERLRQRTFATHEQARSSVFQYIEEFYNRRRLHSTLGYRSPDEVEREHLQGAAVAVAAAA
jgi:putative transposase